MEFGPDDRVLAMCPVGELPSIAARVSLLVGLLDADAVYEARAALRDYPNTMIVPSDPDGTIPWKDEFFTAVYAPSAAAPTTDMLRVLASGGSVVLADGVVIKP